jgi:hypothetical protein
VNAAKVPAIGKTEHTPVEFESDIDMDAVFALVRALLQFFSVCKPEKLPVEFEMHGQQAAVQDDKNIFALALDSLNAAALGLADNV